MNTEYLEYILEIERCSSINKAAKNLFISQPSLSGILKNIEKEIGYRIFERTSVGIFPTEKGKMFLSSCGKISHEIAKLKLLGDDEPHDAGMSVSASYSSLLSHTFFNYKREYPEKQVTDIYREGLDEQNLKDLQSRRSKLALIYFSKHEQEQYEALAKRYDLEMSVVRTGIPIRVAAPADHPLARAGCADMNELHRYPFVTYDVDNWENGPGTAGFERRLNAQLITSRSSYYDAIRLCGYISFTMDFAPGEDARNGCVCLPLVNDGGDSYTLAHFTHRGYALSEREARFAAYLRKTLDGMYGKTI